MLMLNENFLSLKDKISTLREIYIPTSGTVIMNKSYKEQLMISRLHFVEEDLPRLQQTNF